MFFWSASLYCAANEFFRQPRTQKQSLVKYVPSYRLSYLGILVGLACLSKYHGFVLGLGLIGFCLTSPPHRCVVRSPWAWLGLGLFKFYLIVLVVWMIL